MAEVWVVLDCPPELGPPTLIACLLLESYCKLILGVCKLVLSFCLFVRLFS